MRGWWIAVLTAMVVLGLVSVARAEEPLVISVKHTPPFVIAPSAETKPEGFSIELAEEIGRRLDPPRAVRFVLQPDLERQLDAVASGRVDGEPARRDQPSRGSERSTRRRDRRNHQCRRRAAARRQARCRR